MQIRINGRRMLMKIILEFKHFPRMVYHRYIQTFPGKTGSRLLDFQILRKKNKFGRQVLHEVFLSVLI